METVLSEGVPATSILKIAEENTVDLIIMTIEMKGRLERAILGSTAERVIREAHVPVLSIPAGATVATQEVHLGAKESSTPD